MPLRHFVLLLFLAVASIDAATLTLTSSPNPSVYGRQVTLTATVAPAGATGKVTFYDGINIIGVSTISGTTATLNTIALPSGTRSLRAYYWGDATNTAASSASLAHTVSAVSSLGLRRPVNSRPVDFIGFYSSSAVADVNRDGNLDVILAGSYLTVLLGNGSGGFILALNRSLFYSVQSLVVGDWNSDGRPDIAYGISGGNASVALGNGDGNFQNGVPVDTGSTAEVLGTGDWNRDGKADLIAGSTAGSTDLRVYLGNGLDTKYRSCYARNSVRESYL